uniref:Uncharacterized protein n=1 Tax=Chlamydomonas leiostraca TaxID=1034604 RepID=A0A7S0WYN7_9CHLO
MQTVRTWGAPHPFHGARSASARKCVLAKAAKTTAAAPVIPAWPEFCRSASGEWEGVSCTFNGSGEAQPLPSNYVPDAYRQWGVELYDWQTVVSSRALPEQPGQLELVCRRMMPTVGCEADAVAFTEERSGGAASSNGAAAATAAPALRLVVTEADGSYIAAPASLPSEGNAAVEVCMVRGASGEGKAQRVRVVHQLRRNWQSMEWMLAGVDVHNERCDGPYRGLVELCGCGGGMSPFGTTDRVAASQVEGSWRTVSSTGAGEPGSASAAGSEAVLLPLGLWMRSSVQGAEGEVAIEVGTLMPGGSQRKLARVAFKSGQLAHSQMEVQDRS